MPGPLHRFMSEDHERLDALLQRATAEPGTVGAEPYAEFREGLLRHIAMEEKVLLPEAQRARGGSPLEIAEKLRLDHGALAALLVPSPTPRIIAGIRTILSAHNPLEEGPGGLYETCEQLAGERVEEILSRVRAQPRVPVSPHVDGPKVLEAIQRTLTRSGYPDLAKSLEQS